ALRVRLQLALVLLELDTRRGQLVDCAFYVVDRKVQHGERRGHVVGLRIHEDGGAAPEVEAQPLGLLGDAQSERPAVEHLRALEVVDGEARECVRAPEHQSPPAVAGSACVCSVTPPTRKSSAPVAAAATAKIAPTRN